MSRNPNLNFSSGLWPARLSHGPQKPTWKSKLDPFFLRVAEFHRKIAETHKINPREYRSLLKEARRRHKPSFKPGLRLLGLESLPEGSTISWGELMLRRICRYKYNTTPEELLRKRNAGDFKAARKFIQLCLDYENWAFGKWDARPESFKSKPDHHLLISLGLHFGIQNLTQSELADCFNEICPCGDKEHSEESLRKLRIKIQRHYNATSREHVRKLKLKHEEFLQLSSDP